MVAKVPNLTFWRLHISHFFLFVICIVILCSIVIFICVILWYFAIFCIAIFSPMMRGKLCRAVIVIWVSQNGFVEEIIVRSWNPYYEWKWFKCCGLQEYDFFGLLHDLEKQECHQREIFGSNRTNSTTFGNRGLQNSRQSYTLTDVMTICKSVSKI